MLCGTVAVRKHSSSSACRSLKSIQLKQGEQLMKHFRRKNFMKSDIKSCRVIKSNCFIYKFIINK